MFDIDIVGELEKGKTSKKKLTKAIGEWLEMMYEGGMESIKKVIKAINALKTLIRLMTVPCQLDDFAFCKGYMP